MIYNSNNFVIMIGGLDRFGGLDQFPLPLTGTSFSPGRRLST
jgi:hypothetical protein